MCELGRARSQADANPLFMCCSSQPFPPIVLRPHKGPPAKVHYYSAKKQKSVHQAKCPSSKRTRPYDNSRPHEFEQANGTRLFHVRPKHSEQNNMTTYETIDGQNCHKRRHKRQKQNVGDPGALRSGPPEPQSVGVLPTAPPVKNRNHHSLSSQTVHEPAVLVEEARTPTFDENTHTSKRTPNTQK